MPAAKTIQQKKEEALAKMNQSETNSKSERSPRSRKGTFGGLNQKLGVDKTIEGFHLHWLNDSPGRIPEALEAGYEHVKEKEVYSYSNSEEYVSRHVGTSEKGEGMTAFLMKIRQDWYEEDQSGIQTQNDKFDEAIRKGRLESVSHSYGQENIRYQTK